MSRGAQPSSAAFSSPGAFSEAVDGIQDLLSIWEYGCMEAAGMLDIEAIRRACERYGVERLRVFGSILTDQFDPQTSDIDFLVAFRPQRENLFHDYLDLKAELERISGRGVDLIVERSIKNPFFRASAFESAQDVYAA